MNKGGNILRLIDIVLILLFGFISISEVSHRSKIRLPNSTETPQTPPDREEIIIVGISSQGDYLVGNESFILSTVNELQNYLKKEKTKAVRAKKSIRVRVRPNWNTPVEHAMAVAAICDQLQLPKGMDVRRTDSKGGM
ncbi:MAG: ExbD/TolR family protein [bacterium]